MTDDEEQGAAARRDDEAAARRARTGRTSRARTRTHAGGVGVVGAIPYETKRQRRARAREEFLAGLSEAGARALRRAEPRPRFASTEEAAASVDRRLAQVRPQCDHRSVLGRLTCGDEATD